MRRDFEQLADTVCEDDGAVDRTTLFWAAESTDFLRFNHARVRQATHVEQRYGTLAVVRGARRLSSRVSLSGDIANDAQMLLSERARLIADLPLVPEDPYLLLPHELNHTERDAAGRLPDARQVIEAVAARAKDADLVGFYAGGPIARGFAGSRGQRNWHRVESFNFDWCLYRSGDKAVSSSYAGTMWDEATFAARMTAARQQIELLGRPVKTLAPGEYRVCFSPVAVADLLGTLAWGGFGHKDLQTGVNTLIRAHRGQARFSDAVTLIEATAEGIAPRFQPDGFVKPASVPLVKAGKIAQTLVSPRSAREYGVAANGSNEGETPDSLAMAGGTLAESEVLKALDTGAYISNLHYLNYSDRQACRVTGMTRFACFWVEHGRIVAPIGVMRFDDSLLRMFGPGLVALTQGAELVPDSSTYGERALRSFTAPGAIVQGFRFTL
jgi:predicted Zn-dependent protease